jgi:alpha-beta hydrolase superfamily lysophospholipase
MISWRSWQTTWGHWMRRQVILLHGGGQTRHSWSGAAQALAQRGYRVINFDARGHGAKRVVRARSLYAR